jgi:hypothetical protein
MTATYADFGDQLAELLPEDGAAWDQFGTSVAINGTSAIVGARWAVDDGTSSGAAYLFNTDTGEQIAQLLPEDGAAGDQSGWFVAIGDATAIVGAHRDDESGIDSGSAYLFEAADATPGPWVFDASGHVGPFGLVALLGAWGTNPGHVADLNGDGEVGPADLSLLLGNWGRCL